MGNLTLGFSVLLRINAFARQRRRLVGQKHLQQARPHLVTLQALESVLYRIGYSLVGVVAQGADMFAS